MSWQRRSALAAVCAVLVFASVAVWFWPWLAHALPSMQFAFGSGLITGAILARQARPRTGSKP